MINHLRENLAVVKASRSAVKHTWRSEQDFGISGLSS